MSTLYIDDQGASIRISSNEFIIATGDQEHSRVPKSWVERIVIAGNVQISTQALVMMLKESIPVAFMSTKGNYRGSLRADTHKHAALRLAQYDRFRDEEFRLAIGSTILQAKLKNCRTLLMKHHRSHADFHCDMEIEAINREQKKLGETTSIDGLMGHEGVAAHWYFLAFGRMVRSEFVFQTRSRRPPKDPMNAMLSLGYTLLYNEFVTATETIGLDPNIGFLHAIEYGRESLASDMVEEFRWVVDGMVLGLVNCGVVQHEDFTKQDGGGFRMNDQARKKFYAAYEERMTTEVAYRDIHISYRKIFFRQAEHLARVVLGEDEQYLPHLIQ